MKFPMSFSAALPHSASFSNLRFERVHHAPPLPAIACATAVAPPGEQPAQIPHPTQTASISLRSIAIRLAATGWIPGPTRGLTATRTVP